MTNSVMQLICQSVSQSVHQFVSQSVSHWLTVVQRWWDACEKGARGLYFTTGGLFPDSFKQKAIACWMGGWQREGDKHKWQGGGRSPWERPQPRHRGAGGAGEDKKLGNPCGTTPLSPPLQLLSFTSLSLQLSGQHGAHNLQHYWRQFNAEQLQQIRDRNLSRCLRRGKIQKETEGHLLGPASSTSGWTGAAGEQGTASRPWAEGGGGQRGRSR